jgi:hypothetical protein
MDASESEGSDCLLVKVSLERRLQAAQKMHLVDVLRHTDPRLFKTLPTEEASEVAERVFVTYVAAADEDMPGGEAGDVARCATRIGIIREALYKQSISPAWAATGNRLTLELLDEFGFPDGRIDWEKLVRFVSEDTRSKGSKKAHS